MKVCLDLFPKGSFPGQATDGLYMDETLASNLSILSDRIQDDMMFVFLITGGGMVRVGKSVLAMQVGQFLTYEVNRIHKLNNEFNIENNLCWRGDDLIEKAMKLKPYSVLILDEGDDLVDNYWSSLSKRLRRFFRKCGQLNLFLILLLPDYFELSRPYAITRSNFLIDVRFFDDFRRGMFSFYGFKKKKELYVKGKKYGDYDIIPPDFTGRFTAAYVLGEEKYRAAKRKDFENDKSTEEPDNKMNSLIPGLIKLADRYIEEKNITMEDLCKELGISANYLRKTKSLIKTKKINY